jgi:hypothetical protein
MPTISGANKYKLYEAIVHSLTPPADSPYSQVYFGSGTTAYVTPRTVGYRWYKYRACDGLNCSGLSPWKRVYVYTAPGIPNHLSLSLQNVPLNSAFELAWTPAAGAVTGTIYTVYESHNSQPETIVYSVSRQIWSETRYGFWLSRAQGGSYRYRVQACSGKAGCGGSVVANQTVIAPNTAPIANTDVATLSEDTTIYVDVLANDTDAEGGYLTVESYGNPSHGTFSVVNNTMRYQPYANYYGSDAFGYRLRDNAGAYSAQGVAYLTITPVNDSPRGSLTISGQPLVGQTLSLSNTLYDVDELGTMYYQWRRNGSPIAGATGTTYLLHINDTGATLTVTARYTDGSSTVEQVTSAATATVTDTSAKQQLIFIHTDLLGSPVFETNTTGSAN